MDNNSIFRLRREKMGFTHFDEKVKAIMVDVTEKRDTVREATATGKITVNEEVFRAVKEGTAGKGDGKNDILMFEKFPHSRAMGNAVESLKKIAEKVIESNRDDAVAQEVCRLLQHPSFRAVL